MPTSFCGQSCATACQSGKTRCRTMPQTLPKGRISIARAILKNAPIVILDEPTAALDTESEVAVQRAVDALVRERTVFVIAHRLSTIAAADNILVFDRGRLVEQGRHAALLNAGGRYQAMWEAQNRAKEWHLGRMTEGAHA